LAKRAGHDINYLAQTGILHCIARRHEAPMPPLNLVADFGGGGMLLAYGITAALHGRTRTGRGRVIDAAMADGSNLLMIGVWSRLARGSWNTEPGTNDLDTGAPYYNVYRTSDDRYIAIGAVEPEFYRQALQALGLAPEGFLKRQHDKDDWPRARGDIAAAVRVRDFQHWQTIFDELDACVTPVLDLDEAQRTPYAQQRGLFDTVADVIQPAAAPRFGSTGRPSPSSASSVQQVTGRWLASVGTQ
jgi:alpha-methylacyl-CoA racemase